MKRYREKMAAGNRVFISGFPTEALKVDDMAKGSD